MAPYRLDLNSAGAAQLSTLPMIGPARARAIVADRLEYGEFASVDELTRVPGIGAGTVEKLRRYARVDDSR